jgi:hypothetical protein
LLFAATLAFIGAIVALLIPDTSSLLSHGPPPADDFDVEVVPSPALLAEDGTH